MDVDIEGEEVDDADEFDEEEIAIVEEDEDDFDEDDGLDDELGQIEAEPTEEV